MDSVLAITIIGILLIITSVILIAFVLMQSAKNSRMSGVVSGGGAETFFGKYKGKTIDKKLNRLTIIISTVFTAVVILLYIVQPGTGKIDYGDDPDWGAAQNQMTATTTGTGTDSPSTTKPATTTAPATTAPATTGGGGSPSTPAVTTAATPGTTAGTGTGTGTAGG